MNWLAGVICTGEEPAPDAETPAPDVRVEVERYLSEPTPDLREDALVWWKLWENSYPTLSIVARKYLCIPAASNPSERVFSLTGDLVSPKKV